MLCWNWTEQEAENVSNEIVKSINDTLSETKLRGPEYILFEILDWFYADKSRFSNKIWMQLWFCKGPVDSFAIWFKIHLWFSLSTFNQIIFLFSIEKFFLIQSKVSRQWSELWICISVVDLSLSTRLKLCSENNYLWPCDRFFFCNTQMFWLFIIKSAKNQWFLSLTNLYLTAVNLTGVRWLAL